jgi:uncharacterized protein YqeY
MTLIFEIKAAQLAARKERRAADVAVLTTLIGEAEIIGKNDGNRAVTDQEVQAVIKKFIKNIDEVLKVVNPGSDQFTTAQEEKILLSTFLPVQLSEADLRLIIQTVIDAHQLVAPKGLGVLMKELKDSHNGTYDGALASKLAKELLK